MRLTLTPPARPCQPAGRTGRASLWHRRGPAGKLGAAKTEVAMSNSRCLILTLAMVLFGGTGQKEVPPPPAPDTVPAPKDDPPPRAAEKPPAKEAPPPAPVIAWTQDVREMRFRTAPVSGKLCGRPFASKTCELSRMRERFLVLRQGDEFNPELEVRILLSSDRNESFSG